MFSLSPARHSPKDTQDIGEFDFCGPCWVLADLGGILNKQSLLAQPSHKELTHPSPLPLSGLCCLPSAYPPQHTGVPDYQTPDPAADEETPSKGPISLQSFRLLFIVNSETAAPLQAWPSRNFFHWDAKGLSFYSILLHHVSCTLFLKM